MTFGHCETALMNSYAYFGHSKVLVNNQKVITVEENLTQVTLILSDYHYRLPNKICSASIKLFSKIQYFFIVNVFALVISVHLYRP